jgi:hypothetical protein
VGGEIAEGAAVGVAGPLDALQAGIINNPNKLPNTNINVLVIPHHWFSANAWIWGVPGTLPLLL